MERIVEDLPRLGLVRHHAQDLLGTRRGLRELLRRKRRPCGGEELGYALFPFRFLPLLAFERAPPRLLRGDALGEHDRTAPIQLAVIQCVLAGQRLRLIEARLGLGEIALLERRLPGSDKAGEGHYKDFLSFAVLRHPLQDLSG